MNDIEKMHGTCEITQTDGEMAVLAGSAPVIAMRNYHKEVAAYTRGLGRLFCTLKGYEPCHNAEEVIESIGYDSEKDVENPTGSVFCSHGTSFLVSWDKVKDYMHVESYLQNRGSSQEEGLLNRAQVKQERQISLEEIDRIINSTYYANQGKKSAWKRSKTPVESYYRPVSHVRGIKESREEYLLVDGYNIIHAWPELKSLADENMESARVELLDILSNYQGIRKSKVIVVFDAYRVQGHREEIVDYHNIHIVYTREAQTADQYIEKFAHDNIKKYNITVATSDGLEQIIIRAAGCTLLSASELKAEIDKVNEIIKQEYREKQAKDRNYLKDALSPQAKQQMEDLMKKRNDN